MTDEDKKRIVSEPPPPTDEIDGEWGDDDQTLIRDTASVSNSQPAPARTAAPNSVPPKAAEAATPAEMKAVTAIVSSVEDEEEDDEEDDDVPATNEDDEEDEDEEQDEDDDGDVPAAATATAPTSSDRLPDWAPYAVLAGLVAASIVFGLGLLGGSAAASDEGEKTAEPAASTVKAPAKPSPHP